MYFIINKLNFISYSRYTDDEFSNYLGDLENFKHESSWDDLQSILRNAVSGCNLSIHKTYSQNIMRKTKLKIIW